MGQGCPFSLKFNASFLLKSSLRIHALLIKMSSAQSRELSSAHIRNHKTLLCLSTRSLICHRATAILQRPLLPLQSLLVAEEGELNGQVGLREISDIRAVYKVGFHEMKQDTSKEKVWK
jgi:hypothetical protein